MKVRLDMKMSIMFEKELVSMDFDFIEAVRNGDIEVGVEEMKFTDEDGDTDNLSKEELDNLLGLIKESIKKEEA